MRYQVWRKEDGEEDARRIEGTDITHAACEWARWYDSNCGGYYISASGKTVVVFVKDDKGMTHEVDVTGACKPVYHAEFILTLPKTSTVTNPEKGIEAMGKNEALCAVKMAEAHSDLADVVEGVLADELRLTRKDLRGQVRITIDFLNM